MLPHTEPFHTQPEVVHVVIRCILVTLTCGFILPQHNEAASAGADIEREKLLAV